MDLMSIETAHQLNNNMQLYIRIIKLLIISSILLSCDKNDSSSIDGKLYNHEQHIGKMLAYIVKLTPINNPSDIEIKKIRNDIYFYISSVENFMPLIVFYGKGDNDRHLVCYYFNRSLFRLKVGIDGIVDVEAVDGVQAIDQQKIIVWDWTDLNWSTVREQRVSPQENVRVWNALE